LSWRDTISSLRDRFGEPSQSYAELSKRDIESEDGYFFDGCYIIDDFHDVPSESELMNPAVEILRAGGVVGMPTETVYGLAADARSSDAVAKIFALKGRPSTNPLIVHVASVEVGERYAMFDDRARKLFARFAPGALTVVLPRRESFSASKDPHPNPLPQAGEGTGDAISPLVSAGLDTVGIRIPNHPVALELLRAFDGPLAAPSANKSNHVSPTTAQHVRDEFGPDLLVLDGGPCRVGIESTVLDLSKSAPTILRPGGITREQIESVLGPVHLFRGHVDVTEAAVSPGQQKVHYAPRAPAYRFDASGFAELFSTLDANVPATFILLTFGVDLALPAGSLIRAQAIGPDPDRASREFYGALREADQNSSRVIYVEMPPDRPEWIALRDRITRATTTWMA
jgi:L-threonylcarbamoyladenylate synthase